MKSKNKIRRVIKLYNQFVSRKSYRHGDCFVSGKIPDVHLINKYVTIGDAAICIA